MAKVEPPRQATPSGAVSAGKVSLTIDGRPVQVAPGTLVVDAAKKAGIDIPVFCYHPKMEPVGMCRMCLVEIGRPVIDRTTNQPVLEADGRPRLQFSPKLETACTTPVVEGMAVLTTTPKVGAARKEVLEFILTSHPLDCPICDKGGECPLQNLTMAYGPGQSRFLFDEKMHLAKHVPLGELIYLDRERCIQCSRCVRFQETVVDDPVLAFTQRGRSLEIITSSKPGFDSIFSGNTTDICPVGALTTADFRFGARPWELQAVASICNHCPVGCNIVYNIRREAVSGGRTVIKRVMPRQNEMVNEIWMCDKGRFAYHYTESSQRLTQPLMRLEGELKPVNWEEALAQIAAQMHRLAGLPLGAADPAADTLPQAERNRTGWPGEAMIALVGGRLANEDLFNLRQLTQALGGRAVLYSPIGGGEWTTRYGLAPGSNFGEMGSETAILVIASDLHQEAPLWWLRVKQAAQRGATLIVANPRPTRLDRYASHVLRYDYGAEVATLGLFLPSRASQVPQEMRVAVKALEQAQNVVILFGAEGVSVENSAAIARVGASVLATTNRTGRPNNGLVGVWPNGNTQGAFELGLRPLPLKDLAAALSSARLALIAAADPAGDSPLLAQALEQAGFVVVQELFLTETAKRADVVLPVQAYSEREGSYTSGERRVQRFYPAVPARPGPLADYAIAAQLGQRLLQGQPGGEEIDLEGRAPALIFERIAQSVPAFAGLNYAALAQTAEQWPIIGRHDLYFGGTMYENSQGLGRQLALADGPSAWVGHIPDYLAPIGYKRTAEPGVFIAPVTRLYDRGMLMEGYSAGRTAPLLAQRLAPAALSISRETAARLELADGGQVLVEMDNLAFSAAVCLDDSAPPGVALLPRSVGLPVVEPGPARIKNLTMAKEL